MPSSCLSHRATWFQLAHVDPSETLYLFPGQTIQQPFNYKVNESFPKGLYSLTLEAIEVNDPAMPPSSATATLTIF